MLVELRDWTTWVAEWVIVVLILVSIWYEKETLKMVIKEFEYDEAKDIEKKQKRTKTSKKTTTVPGGSTIVEESTETTVPMDDKPETKGEVK